MLKILIIAFVLFIFQMSLLNHYNENIVNKIASLNNVSYEETQRSIFNVLKQIDDSNKQKEKNIYIFGASSTREFIPLEKEINIFELNSYNKVVVATTSSQPLIASLLMIEQISVPDSIVIMGMTPKKYMTEGKDYIDNMYTHFGNKLKYPIISQSLQSLYIELNFSNNTFIPSSLYLISGLLKSYIFEQANNIVDNGLYGIKLHDNSKIEQHYKKYVKSLDDNSLLKLEKKYFIEVLKSKEKVLENMSVNDKILKKIINIAREKRIKLVLFDIPINHIFPKLYSEELKFYNKSLNSLNIKRIIFDQLSSSSNSFLFHDTSHLNKDGKAYYHDYFKKGFENAISE